MIEKIKRLFISEAGEHINKQVKEIINTEGELDEQRMKFYNCLQEYYSLKNNRNKTSDLINRLQEISENRDAKFFWMSIIICAFIGVLVTVGKELIDHGANAIFVLGFLAGTFTSVAIAGWILYSRLDSYNRLHLQKQEKEFIEKVLEYRRNNLQDKQAETVDCAAHPTTKP